MFIRSKYEDQSFRAQSCSQRLKSNFTLKVLYNARVFLPQISAPVVGVSYIRLKRHRFGPHFDPRGTLPLVAWKQRPLVALQCGWDLKRTRWPSKYETFSLVLSKEIVEIPLVKSKKGGTSAIVCNSIQSKNIYRKWQNRWLNLVEDLLYSWILFSAR